MRIMHVGGFIAAAGLIRHTLTGVIFMYIKGAFYIEIKQDFKAAS
jgi:hypothetical protein